MIEKVSGHANFGRMALALAISIWPLPLGLYCLTQTHLLPMPTGVGPQAFLSLGNDICIFALPLFVIINLWMRSRLNWLAYLLAGALAPLPITLYDTLGFSALADDAEWSGRLFVLWMTPLLGGLIGILFGFLSEQGIAQGN